MFNKLLIAFITVVLIFSINTTVYSQNTNSTKYSNEISSATLKSLTETIVALDITRNKYQSELSLQNAVLKNEYLIFINYLSFQINHYCVEINNKYGEKALKKLPCYVNSMAGINSDDETPEEKIQSLDDEFMTALGEFDEMLLNEDEKIVQSSQNKAAQTESNTSKKGSKKANMDGDGEGEATNNKDLNEQLENKNNNTERKNSRIKGNKKQTSGKSYQRKKLDKIDDDIVSRQLKEAAEKETDPELKEKLWEEYYKYKKTIGK